VKPNLALAGIIGMRHGQPRRTGSGNSRGIWNRSGLSHLLGIETVHGRLTTLILKGTPLPAAVRFPHSLTGSQTRKMGAQ
jgi:hypothetical protein